MDEKLDRKISRGRWSSLFVFTTRAHLLPLAVSISLAALSGAVIPALAYFLGIIFDAFSKYGTGGISGGALMKEISTYALYLVFLGSVSWVLKGSFFAAWLAFGELQAKSARNQLYAGMLAKEMDWHDMRSDGVDSFTPRLQSHIRELQIAVSQPLGFGLQYVVTATVALGLALYSAWDLTLVTIAGIPICALILAWISAHMQSAIHGQFLTMTKASKASNSAINAIDTVKCYNRQSSELWQYADILKRAAVYYLQQARYNALQIGLVRLLVLTMFVQGFWFGNHLVESGRKTAGQILTCFWSALIATQVIQQILPQMLVLEKGKAAGATLKEILVSDSDLPALEGRVLKKPQNCNGDVELKNVSFTYPSRLDNIALKNADMVFAAGQTTFVVGVSGSGKSTISNLLLKLYNPQDGRITIDGNNLDDLDTNWVRKNIMVVQQQAVLFNESISTNIGFGKINYHEPDKRDLESCVELAGLAGTILALHEGLDTVLGPGGTSLSGGQKQKVAIARGRFRDAPIIVLDEATSAMDQTSKNHVMDGIRRWRQGKTTIIITHDLSSIPDDKYAYILENGRIIKEGIWESLKYNASVSFTPSLDMESELPSRFSQVYGRSQTVEFNFATTPSTSRFSVATTKLDAIDYPTRLSVLPNISPIPQGVDHSKRQSLVLGTLLAPLPLHLGHISNTRESVLPLISMSRQPNRSGLNPPSTAPGVLEDVTAAQNRFKDFSARLPPPEKSENRVSTIFEMISSSTEADATPSITLLKDALGLSKRKVDQSNDSKQTVSLLEIFATVWPALRIRSRLALIGGFAFAFVHAASTPVFAWVFSKLLAIYFLPLADKSAVALTWSMGLLGVSLVDATASYMMHYLLEMSGQAWVDRLRLGAMQCILDQPQAWFDQDNGNLILCLDRSAEEMRNLLGRFAGLIFVAVVMVLIAFTWCLLLCWKLTLVGLAAGPLIYIVTRVFEKVSKVMEGKSNEAGEEAGRIFAETFAKIRTVKALSLEDYFRQKHEEAAISAFKVGLRRAGYSGMFFGISDTLTVFVTALIFWYGSQLAAASLSSIQSIITVFSMLLFSISSANGIVAFIPQIKMSQDTATKLLGLANLPLHRSHEHKGRIRLTNIPGPISFENLTFSYPSRPTQTVLSCLNLKLPLGRSTALVGKTTIAALLLGLYSPIAGSQVASMDTKPNTHSVCFGLETLSSGRIMFGSHTLSSLHLPSLRSLIGYVSQQIMLFPGTIAKNIAYGLNENKKGNNNAVIKRAAMLAGIDDFVSSLPQGYETLVGEGGTQLSGGQVQRLGIARALVRQPELLIMDEPTSNLDSENSLLILATIRGLVGRGTTVLVITHNPEMMRAMDGIVMLEEGKVVEQGRWQELMQRRDGRLVDMLRTGRSEKR